jgi:hypothetical protein
VKTRPAFLIELLQVAAIYGFTVYALYALGVIG